MNQQRKDCIGSVAAVSNTKKTLDSVLAEDPQVPQQPSLYERQMRIVSESLSEVEASVKVMVERLAPVLNSPLSDFDSEQEQSGGARILAELAYINRRVKEVSCLINQVNGNLCL